MSDAIKLGAALYVPASRRDLDQIVNGNKLSEVRTIILCTEDAILEHEVPVALENLERVLAGMFVSSGRRLYVRVRSPAILRRILEFKGVEQIEGFVLPKARLDCLSEYFALLKNSPHRVMPTLETREVFDQSEMIALLRYFDRGEVRKRILLLRIGGNDLLSLIGMRRPVGKTIYQTPIGHVIAQLVTTFRPYGFELSAPVFEYLDDPMNLAKEVEEDLAHGLVGKTAIHPMQVPDIERQYCVGFGDVEMARRILSEHAPAVFKCQDAMCEPATHRNWAERILSAADEFGIREPASGGQRISLAQRSRR